MSAERLRKELGLELTNWGDARCLRIELDRIDSSRHALRLIDAAVGWFDSGVTHYIDSPANEDRIYFCLIENTPAVTRNRPAKADDSLATGVKRGCMRLWRKRTLRRDGAADSQSREEAELDDRTLEELPWERQIAVEDCPEDLHCIYLFWSYALKTYSESAWRESRYRYLKAEAEKCFGRRVVSLVLVSRFSTEIAIAFAPIPYREAKSQRRYTHPRYPGLSGEKPELFHPARLKRQHRLELMERNKALTDSLPERRLEARMRSLFAEIATADGLDYHEWWAKERASVQRVSRRGQELDAGK